MSQAIIPTKALPSRRSAAHWGDLIFAGVTRAAAVFILLLLGSIIVMLAVGGWPAFKQFGPGFITSTTWDSVNDVYGAGVPIYGTLLTSVLAMVLAVPVSFGIAYYLTELAPGWLRRPVGVAIELLAAVPSIIYGMWGFFVIVPFMAKRVEPALITTFKHVPVLHSLFMGPAFGTGVFTSAFILAVMVLPFIAATMRDVFATVPAVYKESAYGVGCTTWEVVRSVVLPYTKTAVVGGIMLGLGRALGETMAVTYVIGNADRISPSLFAAGNTISSLVALEFGEADSGSIKLAALMALGLILFVISFIVLAISRLMLRPKFKE